MENYNRYQRNYFMPKKPSYDWVQKEYIDKPPYWCSVDLRDGNQALIEPMSLEEKLEFFKMLVEIGFKEIEVGFPAASETEYNFIRALIENNLIPKDVTIQVLTQAREHIIKKTFEAVKGAPHAVIHVYNSTSVAQREQVFAKNKEEVKEIAINGARLLKKLASETEGNFLFEYSPESFTGTEVEYALEVINAVIDEWKPTKENRAIINLPATVELSLPHVFATQVEYIHKNMKHRNGVILSLHPHNDRGTGVAIAELGLLAGADRIEGTLFGNGERTGNVDVVTLAMNMYSHGVDPKLNFSKLPEIKEVYERLTRMEVSLRQPYAGELVFTAFSGSHQDAISKGFVYRGEHKEDKWVVPYLPIDPKDVGRSYDGDVIRINSQSGKGGVSYILRTNYGIEIPKNMQEELGYTVKSVSDHEHTELTADRIYDIFLDKYVNNKEVFSIRDAEFVQSGGFLATVCITHNSKERIVKSNGNGRLDAVANALRQYFDIDYDISEYEEHALTKGSTSKAVTFVGVVYENKKYWGVGFDEDIIKASIDALVSALNQLEKLCFVEEKEERLNNILNIIQENYRDITLEKLAEKTYLSKPYLSKYIKAKSGLSFGDNVRMIRLKKAKSLLVSGNLKVEIISEIVGYPNVEHFIRIFKREFGKTPSQFRSEANRNK
ncbi:MAG: 2-isopropylmalate synthase [Catonella sp.]|uniref:2-isopropylmalate synthase n=1 Tax=Catonella sp. TaxID=2382125 RepID=UPI003F9F5ECE